MSIFVSNDTLETDLRSSAEIESGALFLDLPLGGDSNEGTEVRYFDALTTDTDVVPVVPEVPAPDCPSHRHRQGLGGWGPRVRRRRAPRAVFAAASPARPKLHGTGRWLVALLILAALPLGAALGYYLSLAPPVAVLSPELLDFGSVAVGEMVERQATLENRGEQALRVLDITLAGGKSTEFALLAAGCRGVALEPAARCALRVAFRPTSAGALRAEVVLRSNAVDGLRVLPLLGEGR